MCYGSELWDPNMTLRCDDGDVEDLVHKVRPGCLALKLLIDKNLLEARVQEPLILVDISCIGGVLKESAGPLSIGLYSHESTFCYWCTFSGSKAVAAG